MKRKYLIFLSIFLLLILGTFYYVTTYLSYNYIKKDYVLEANNPVTKKISDDFFALRLSEASVAIYDKKLLEGNLTKEEIDFYTFEKSKLLGMFGKKNQQFTIINSLVNSSSSEKNIRSSAAYDIFHAYFEDGDLNKVLVAIKNSKYMSRYTKVLENRKYNLVNRNPLGMNREQKDMLLMNYLDVAGEYEHSMAITSTAADLYAQYYQILKPVASKKVSDVFINKSLGNLNRTLSILNDLEGGEYKLPSSDIVIGLNHMARAMERYEKEGVKYDNRYKIDKVYEDSVKLSKEEAPNLYVFTTYLQSIYLSNKSIISRADAAKIKSNLSFIYSGNLSTTSFARIFIEARSSDNEVFGKTTVAKLANIDDGLKIFLLKNGWIEEDFK